MNDLKYYSIYVQHLSPLTFIMTLTHNKAKPGAAPSIVENFKTPQSDSRKPPPEQWFYNCDVTHVAEVNFVKNRYMTPVTIAFDTPKSKFIVNISSKYQHIFTTTKIFAPSTNIITNNNIIPKSFKRVQITPSNSRLSTTVNPTSPRFR